MARKIGIIGMGNVGAAPPIVRPATQTRTRCVLKQGSPV